MPDHRDPPILHEQPPTAPLSRWVECAWFLNSTEAVPAHRVPPDGCLDIVYDRANGLRAIGTMTKEQQFHFSKGAYLAGVRFRPGLAGSFLGVRPVELTDSSTLLEDLWPRRARELQRQLDDSESVEGAMRILFGNLPAPNTALTPTQRALEALAAANGNANLGDMARHANLSPRQFRRRCLEESGLTPKQLCRVLRFRHACRMAGEHGRPNWSAIAAEAEYFDQAHLIRDFHQFTGQTPMSVFSNTRQRRSG
ncbi:MAG: helix-turn-helix domain-containing protein [Bryobacteraceae bacterium]